MRENCEEVNEPRLQKMPIQKVNENSKKGTITYEEALEKAGNGKFQYLLVVVGGFIIYSSYVSVCSISYILPAAQCDLNMDSVAKGRLISAGFFGLIISCHLWGFLSDTLGRRFILVRCLFVDALLYFVISLTPYYSAILILRLVHGFASSGGVVAVYAYVGEFLTERHRTSALMVAATIAQFINIFTPVAAGLTITGDWRIYIYPGFVFKPWRLYYAVCGLPSLISAIFLYNLPESPKFLLAKGKTTKAIQVLEKIQLFNGKNKENTFSVKDIEIRESEKVAKLDYNKNKAAAFVQLMWNQTAPLFKEPNRKNIALICLSQAMIYFSNGGLFLWLPESINRLSKYREKTNNEFASFCDVVQYEKCFSELNYTTGIVVSGFPISTAIPTNEKTCSDDVDTSVYMNLAFPGAAQLVILCIITPLLRILNKKIILLVMTFSSLLSAIAIRFIYATDLIVMSLFLLIGLTGILIPIINSIIVDLFPTNLRGMAACLVLMSCRLGTVTTNLIAGSLIDNHCHEFVFTFIVTMAICLVSVSILPVKYKEVEEVQISTSL